MNGSNFCVILKDNEQSVNKFWIRISVDVRANFIRLGVFRKKGMVVINYGQIEKEKSFCAIAFDSYRFL